MRFIVATFMFVASLFPVGALADDAQGTITKIDADNSTITLDDGKIYKLPGEFDLSVISKGMKVTLMFDVVDKELLITDIEETQQ
jgi:Cu/Ag efflux protein CusF